MTSNELPGVSGGDHYDDGLWDECEDCHGEGVIDGTCQCEAFEDTCCCLHPEPATCRTCNGKGGFHIDFSAEDQAMWEAEKGDK